MSFPQRTEFRYNKWKDRYLELVSRFFPMVEKKDKYISSLFEMLNIFYFVS